jgi:hypothetical protein
MRVAATDLHVAVACPFCGHTFQPESPAASVGEVGVGERGPTRRNHPPQGLDGYSWRNRWVAGILGVLVGSFGVHRFYLGHHGIGVLQIILTFCTFGIGGLWGFIEGVLCLTGSDLRDVDGLPLRSEALGSCCSTGARRNWYNRSRTLGGHD